MAESNKEVLLGGQVCVLLYDCRRGTPSSSCFTLWIVYVRWNQNTHWVLPVAIHLFLCLQLLPPGKVLRVSVLRIL